jgi:regulator of protease activity HflC (stomatin/prohibitin superfamily)
MERKNITIREDQEEWVDERDINLSQLVQDAIDENMSPTEDELAAAYQANADHAAETNEEWAAVSTEANQHLGEPPRDE